MVVGVLALQGGFQAHVDALTAIGEEVVLVKTPQQLSACDGLVIPGGESTTMLTLMNYDADWFPMLKSFAQQHWIFGTCAGMILLAKHVEPNQPSLGLIDINVERNAYGRQIDSKIENLPYTFINGQQADVEVVFIRAPQIKYVGEQVVSLLFEGQTPLLVQQGSVMAASFHPESSINLSLYKDCIQRLQASV